MTSLYVLNKQQMVQNKWKRGRVQTARGREGGPRVELLRDLRGPFGCWSLWVLVTFLFLHGLLGIQIYHLLAYS